MFRFRQSLGKILLLATLLSIGAPGVPVCEATVHPDDGPCRTPQATAAEVVAADGESSDSAEDCCTTGCGDCALPCCARPAVVLVQLPSGHAAARVQTVLAAVTARCPWTEADPELRPPQV